MPLVAGIDSSTQSCKVVVCDAETGAVVRTGHASHPEGTEVAPEAWWDALQAAIDVAGGLDDVAAVAVGGQQHGMVCLDAAGEVVRPALLWNDTRSAQAALDLIDELGGPQAWVDAVGLVPVASFTVTKLRWLRDHEPDNARRTAAVCLPHDYLTWRLSGSTSLDDLVTDRGDASGTGYWSPATGDYRRDLLELGLGHDVILPRVLGPSESGLSMPSGALLGPGTGDNAGAALGLGAVAGDVVVSIGTSGVACAVADQPVGDVTGAVAGFADATGRFLPLVATLNAARVLDAAARLLDVDHGALSDLALSAPAGAGGLVLVPYLEGERTPNKPDATGALHGLRLETTNPAYLARAAVEGMICGLADAVDAVRALGTPVERIILVGGAARSAAVREIASAVLGLPVSVPAPGEYVARGAARQAAWVLAGSAEPPAWPLSGVVSTEAEPTPAVRERYASVRDLTASRP
ncbi:xylulose kinase [Nocardioides sp. Root1257]|uniref:xylulokinase n=1 Tax=unclassified Nocardioides TaxID=2615069 RepID=UPI0006FDE210|nr:MULTISPECIES: xylulokinase [unclassified Nocardioides]KQW53724.1 xylulose kinase [Nocardioides sp. Root1257]KRC56410.1 xylulose kinase [Nocardioides sp. Root224]